jgi:hypothetical protein
MKPSTNNAKYDAINAGLIPFIKEYPIGKMNSILT